MKRLFEAQRSNPQKTNFVIPKYFYNFIECVFLSSFSQSDSLKNKFTVGISPLLIFSPTPDIFYLEFQPKKESFSIEVSGGTFNSFKLLLGSLPNSSSDPFTGFTIRSGIKFYQKPTRGQRKGIFYYEIIGFYRQMQYNDRFYPNNADTDQIF